jgi:DNA-binding CsgD family transcriptional regulator
MDFRSRHVEAIARIGTLSSSRAVAPELGYAVLDELRRVVDFAAASLSAFDPVERRHRTVANAGYDMQLLGYLESDWTRDRTFKRIYRRRWPDRMDDVPYDFRATEAYVDHLGAAGFEEGMTSCLFAPGGRFAGTLNISVVDRRAISDEARHLIGLMGPTLAQSVDLVRMPSWLPLIAPNASALGVTAEAQLVPLAEREPGPLLARERRLHELAAEHLTGQRMPTRLLWSDPELGWRAIQMINVAGNGAGLDLAVIIDEPTELPHGLTPRELDVLTLVSAGRTNRDIAEAFVVTTRTVATHIEHLLEKLGQTSRAGLAGIAIAEGLIRAPSQLLDRARHIS